MFLIRSFYTIKQAHKCKTTKNRQKYELKMFKMSLKV